MVDAELGWHLLLTTIGTEPQREIRINPAVDLPDEIHPAYTDDDMALARATVAIDEAAHYRDDVTVSCPLGLGAGLGDVASVPVDGVAFVGQVESITWTGTPDGANEQAVIRRHVAIAPDEFVEPVVIPPVVADDTGSTDAATPISGNVLVNDEAGLSVIAVNGLSSNIGVAVDGSNGGTFTISSDGSWTFDPDSDFALLSGTETADTSVSYHATDGLAEASATLTVTVNRYNEAPVTVDDTLATTADIPTSGNVLTNDIDVDTLTVSKVNGSGVNVGQDVAGSGGGLFNVGSDGAWTFDPNGDFDELSGEQSATTGITYHASDGMAETIGYLTVTVTPPLTGQGIEFVGATAVQGQKANYAVPMPTGAQPGDLVIVMSGSIATVDYNIGVVAPSGYTELADLYANDSYDTNMTASYKILGAVPETEVIVNGSIGHDIWGSGAIAMLWRGVDQTSPMDVTHTAGGGGNSSNANPPAITPLTPGSVVVAMGAWYSPSPNATTTGFPTGYENTVTVSHIPPLAGAQPFSIAACSKVWSGDGPEDPANFTDASSNTMSSWCAITVALRPA
jgi:VCBS repeat-containing protein